MQNKDKRNRYPAIPKNVDEFLSEDQKLALLNLRQFGTDIQFIRRPPFQEPMVVLAAANGRTLGILDREGNINTGSHLVLRT